MLTRNMLTERNGKRYYRLGEAAQAFGIGINVLLTWAHSGEVETLRGNALDILFEETSLRGRIARHQGDKR